MVGQGPGAKAEAEEKQKRVEMDRLKGIYSNLDTSNPFTNMENTMEDLTVDTRAAEFQMEQGSQQRANIMQSLRGSAGGSGIAALAQSLANQGVLQASQVSTNIAQQERQNQVAEAQMAGQIQSLERQGASAADMAYRGGEAMVQQAEMSRQATLLGVEYGGMAGANAGVQSAYAEMVRQKK